MTELEIALLGGLRLRHPDRGPIELAGEKGPQLLARLACPPGTKHRRDTLQALLWPDSDPPHAQGNLRFVLHQLRKLLGGSEGPLRSDSRSVWLDPDRVAVDVVRFEALAAEGTLEALAAACDLYRGDLLSDVGRSQPRVRGLAPARTGTLARSGPIRLLEPVLAQAVARRGDGSQGLCPALSRDRPLLRAHACGADAAASDAGRACARGRALWRAPCPPGTGSPDPAGRRGRATRPGRGSDRVGALLRSRSMPPGFWAAATSPRRASPSWPYCPSGTSPRTRRLVSLPAALTEDVIADLARFRRLGVLARHTSFALGRDPDPEARLRQLGARYTVEGSVRRTGNRLERDGSSCRQHLAAASLGRTLPG